MHAHAIVLAGADNSGRLAEASSEKYEATIDINGKPMIEWVLEGVLRARSIDGITVVGPAEALAPIVERMAGHDRITVVERRRSLIENLMAGIEQVPAGEKALVLSSDIPFITGEALDGFVDMCSRMPAGVHYALVRKEVNEEKFPGGKRTYIKLADGTVTGGNAFMFDPPVIKENYDIISQAFGLRKKPFGLLTMIGVPFVVKYLLGRLSIADVERKAESWLGLIGRGVIVPYAEIGVDVDKPEDLEMACRMLPREAR